jgi:hypothetical protein
MSLIEGGEHWKGKPQGYAGPKKEKAPSAARIASAADAWAESRDTVSDADVSVLRGALTEPMPTVYRGLRVSSVDQVDMDTFMSAHMPGSVVDLDVSSFTSRLDVAETFAHRGREPGDDSGSIVLKVTKGGVGMDLSSKLTDDIYGDAEWVTGGRFKVGHIIDRPGRDRQVELTQVAVLGG